MIADIVKVDLGSRAYDIHVGAGLLARAGDLLAPFASRGRVFVITDRTVWKAHGQGFAKALARAGLNTVRFAIPPGEGSKTFRVLQRALERLIEAGADRSDLIVAFGGGVVGDLAGMTASLLKRGCKFAQVPTTLLAMVDSAVGGKTAVNLAVGKNLAGTFHQPCIVISDPDLLSTLPRRELAAGFAEIVKYGALGDAGFFAWLERAGADVLARDPQALARAVRRSCEMKAAIVRDDERESGPRALLNLGHTFGHALEAETGYSDALLHGEAVAAGMGLAFDFSAQKGLCAPEDAQRVKHLLGASGLPAGLEGPAAVSSSGRLVEIMGHDKKNSTAGLTLILVRGIGEAFVAPSIDPAEVERFLAAKILERH